MLCAIESQPVWGTAYYLLSVCLSFKYARNCTSASPYLHTTTHTHTLNTFFNFRLLRARVCVCMYFLQFSRYLVMFLWSHFFVFRLLLPVVRFSLYRVLIFCLFLWFRVICHWHFFSHLFPSPPPFYFDMTPVVDTAVGNKSCVGYYDFLSTRNQLNWLSHTFYRFTLWYCFHL